MGCYRSEIRQHSVASSQRGRVFMVLREIGHSLLAHESDCTLVSLAVAGDEAAFAVLVNRYRAVMGAYAQSILGSSAGADDVVQEVLIKAWDKMSTVRDGEHVKAWLMRAVRNRSIDRLRSARRDPGTLLVEPPARSEEGPFEVVKLLLQNDALALALSNLPVKQRRAWLLREFSGCSYAVISMELDVPESTVRGLLARSRHTLARELAEWH
jgi:RNA polymerase sigma-70 factor (ECF subfamily)